MDCVQSKTTRVRTPSGKFYNRKVHKQRKFRSGLHVEKTGEMGAEANFQAAFTTDLDEKYSRANGNHIPKISDLVSRETQTLPRLSQKRNNTEEPTTSDKNV